MLKDHEGSTSIYSILYNGIPENHILKLIERECSADIRKRIGKSNQYERYQG